MQRCLDDGALQGYLDGELSPAMIERTAAHLASCDLCVAALREAEGELTALVSVFALDSSFAVPTERLRKRIDAAIRNPPSSARARREEKTSSHIHNWFAALAASLMLTPQRAAAFAGVVAVVILGAIFAVVQPQIFGPDNSDKQDRLIALATPSPVVTPSPASPDMLPAIIKSVATAPVKTMPNVGHVVSVNHKATRRTNSKRIFNSPRALAPTAVTEEQAEMSPSNSLLPGEESYLRAIASLGKAIEVGGDSALQPSLRAEYERNLAVVNQAISEARGVARRSPKDGDAHEYLFSAYRNKINLLSAIADQSQVASIGR